MFKSKQKPSIDQEQWKNLSPNTNDFLYQLGICMANNDSASINACITSTGDTFDNLEENTLRLLNDIEHEFDTNEPQYQALKSGFQKIIPKATDKQIRGDLVKRFLTLGQGAAMKLEGYQVPIPEQQQHGRSLL